MDLTTYLQQLDNAAQLKRVEVAVDPQLELAAICRREYAHQDGGSALYFAQMAGCELPVVANLFGSEERMNILLRSDGLGQFSQKIAQLLQLHNGTAAERLRALSLKVVADSCSQTDMFQQVAPDLTALPGIRSWPQEIKPYLTLPLVVTSHPETGETNLGLYRLQILGPDRAALNFAPGSGAAVHLVAAERMKQDLPVAIYFGSDPALYWAACAPLPAGCNEYALCQELFGLHTELHTAVSQPLSVPVDAEIVIEGLVSPGETCVEGPFGNHSGQYVTRRDCPCLRVTALSRRETAIMPLTVVGPPPSENVQLARANECLIKEMLKFDYPQIKTVRMPESTMFHGVTLLTICCSQVSNSKALLAELWQNSPLNRSRLLILLDEGVDLQQSGDCWWRVINQLAPERLYQDRGRLAVDATGVDPLNLVVEDRETKELLLRRNADYNL